MGKLHAPLHPAHQQRRAGRSMTLSIMKLLLPSLTIGLALLVFAWPQLNVEDERFRIGVYDVATDYAESLALLNARFDGFDDEGRPFSISADEATQPSDVDDLVELSLPKGDMTLQDGTWLALTAKNGQYDRELRMLGLAGEVSLFHDEGFELRTESAAIDLENGRAEGHEPVQGQGPFGHLDSDGFRVENHGETIIFTGRTRMILHPEGQDENE